MNYAEFFKCFCIDLNRNINLINGPIEIEL